MSLSIIIPCLNEAGNIEALFKRITQSLENINVQVIFVNDGSYDSTLTEIKEIAEKYPEQVTLVNHVENRGISESWASGLVVAKYSVICFIDGDLQNPPEAIKDLYKVFDEEQADFVQGSRSSIGRLKNDRLLLSRGLNFILNLTFAQFAKDSKSGFIVASKVILDNILIERNSFRNFQTFIGVAARAKGYRVLEVETLFQSREVGKSYLTFKKSLSVVLSTTIDLITGIKIYGRSKQKNEFKYTKNELKHQFTLSRRIRFRLYFSTMKIHKWLIGKDSLEFYFWLKTVEFQSKDQLASIQFERLQKIIKHAYIHVPYYRRSFLASSFKPSDLKSLSDLSKIPLLSKNDVRENVYFNLFSDTHNKKQMIKINTSGSTGEPFVCYADKFQLEMRFANTLRGLEMSGWKFGDRQLRLWHQTLGMNRIQSMKEQIDALFLRRKFIPAFEMSVSSLKKLTKIIEKKKPVLIDGYAESLNFIASATSLEFRHKPLAVISSAQELTDSTREKIENIFGTKVLDKYGSREFSGIAYQCLNSKFHHVQDESYVLEILVDGRPAKIGEIGEVVITDLNNFSMPLIRYRIGDLAVAVAQEPCPCGRAHSLIGQIIGRTQALVLCANGVWLPGTFFAHFFKDYEYAIQHYQVQQKLPNEFTINIVPKSQLSQNVNLEIINNLKNYTGHETVISINIVEEIPLLRTGKRTPVISSVSIDIQNLNNSKIWKSQNQDSKS